MLAKSGRSWTRFEFGNGKHESQRDIYSVSGLALLFFRLLAQHILPTLLFKVADQFALVDE